MGQIRRESERTALVMWFLQDTSTRGRLHRPRGVSAAAAEPQRPGEQRGRRRENPSHDVGGERPDERRRYGDLGRSPLLQLEISTNFASIFQCVTITLLAHYSELLVSSAKADLTLQDAVKNTALHLACTKVRVTCLPPMTNRNGSECL